MNLVVRVTFTPWSMLCHVSTVFMLLYVLSCFCELSAEEDVNNEATVSAEFILCSEDIIIGQPLFAELIIRNKSDANFIFTSYSRNQFVRS